MTKEQLQQHQQQQQQQSRGSWVSVGQPISNMAVAVVRPSYTDAAGGGGGVADAAAAVGTTPPATAEDGAAAAQHLLQPLPRGEVGEVVVAGVGVAAGYLPSATATAAAAAAEGAGAGVGRPLDRFQVASLHMDSTFQQQQQHPNASVAVGPGWAPQDVTAGALTWFRTGDLGCLAADGRWLVAGGFVRRTYCFHHRDCCVFVAACAVLNLSLLENMDNALTHAYAHAALLVSHAVPCCAVLHRVACRHTAHPWSLQSAGQDQGCACRPAGS